MIKDARGSRRNNLRMVGFSLPVFLLAIALAGCAQDQSEAQVVPSPPAATATWTPSSQPAEVIDTPGDGVGMIRGLATPWAVPGAPGAPTPTVDGSGALSSLPAENPVIILQGPPPGSSYNTGDTISFYWQSAHEVGPNQQFSVYLEADASRTMIGSAAATNLGQGFRIQATAGEIVDEPGIYSWSVVLEDIDKKEIIGQSEFRQITILAGN